MSRLSYLAIRALEVLLYVTNPVVKNFAYLKVFLVNRTRLTLENVEQVNARPTDNKNCRKKCALDGLWSTLANSTSAHDLKTYIEKCPRVMKEIIPLIINNAVDKYDYSQKNLMQSVGVLHEGGISSKSQYKRKHCCEIFLS